MKIWVTTSIILCSGFHPLRLGNSQGRLKDMSILQNACSNTTKYLKLYGSEKGKILSIKLTE